MAELHTQTIRLDKWLWYARFFKTRARAAQAVMSGHTRLNGQPIKKRAQQVRVGDVVTFMQGARPRVVEIRACGTRRGPALEAMTLFFDHSPEQSPETEAPQKNKTTGDSGKLSSRDRRHARELKRGHLE